MPQHQPDPQQPDTPTEKPELSAEMRRRIALEERLKSFSKPFRFGRSVMAFFIVAILVAAALATSLSAQGQLREKWWLILVALFGTILYGAFAVGTLAFLRSTTRSRLERELLTVITTRKSEELQERLEENFFTNLVKINFKYIDQYYLQTQLQADKSFMLCAIAACVSLLVIVAGIVMLFVNQSAKDAGYVATGSGILGEFIAAVFFYLYNRTITKMGEYHQKLVLTQNISLALKISEDLPPAEQVTARSKLIDYLSKDINSFLTARPTEDQLKEKKA